MCTNVNEEDFLTIHNVMGKVQYSMQYKEQPIVFRSGANPGFQDAVSILSSFLHWQRLRQNQLPSLYYTSYQFIFKGVSQQIPM